MSRLILPKTFIPEIREPLIFLAGPIKGAPNWQNQAVDLIFSQNPNLTIVSPRRGIREDIAPYVAKGDESYFPRQRAWERYYLDLASRTGAIMFWLPGETEHNCNKSYGAMTRIELGQWMTRYALDKSVSLCFGSDGKFSEIDTIRHDLSIDAPDKRVYETLEETCKEALRLVAS